MQAGVKERKRLDQFRGDGRNENGNGLVAIAPFGASYLAGEREAK